MGANMLFYALGNKMLRIVDDEWLVDTEAMLCSNSFTKIVVGFTKNGETYVGKIKDMPMELTIRLAKLKDGDKLIQKAVLDAEEIFNREMFEKIEERKTS
jgi:hypothetical protein